MVLNRSLTAQPGYDLSEEQKSAAVVLVSFNVGIDLAVSTAGCILSLAKEEGGVNMSLSKLIKYKL